MYFGIVLYLCRIISSPNLPFLLACMLTLFLKGEQYSRVRCHEQTGMGCGSMVLWDEQSGLKHGQLIPVSSCTAGN